MMPITSLRARVFLFSFVTICVTLVASFFAVNSGIKKTLTARLKTSLYKTESAVERERADYQRRNMQLVATLAENPGLKAAIALAYEAPGGRESRGMVRRTVEGTLHDLSVKLDYDFLAVADARGRPIAIAFPSSAPSNSFRLNLESLPLLQAGARLIEAQGKLWETTTAPLLTDQDQLGVLTAGREFSLMATGDALGDLALLRHGHLVATTFPSRNATAVESALKTGSRRGPPEIFEARIDGALELIFPLTRASLGDEFQLFSVRSVDEVMHTYMSGIRTILLAVSAGAMLLALFVATAASASIVRPLARLLANLRESERTGRLQPDFFIRSPLKEANRLAEALNHAALAINDSQERLDRAYLEFTQTMAQALDARDPYTAGHSNRVSAYSVAIAEQLNLGPAEIELIRIGAQLHDIGKIGIPDGILQKPGRLTPEELGLIKMHPQIGKRILQKLERFQEILPMVELHHEDYDGGGYPYGLTGDQTPLCARIVRVADAFDAMSSNRSYRRAMDLALILAELSAMRNRQFDPVVVEAFLAALKKGKYAQFEINPCVAANLDPVVDLVGFAYQR